MKMNEAQSEILKFYKNSSVFLTGATGFLGKVLLEKLLRSCHVKKVYCLVRDKKDKIAEERFNEMLQSPLFEYLKVSNPSALKEKVIIVPGDCLMENLNLSIADREDLIEQVDLVFHVAATIRFDQNLKTATQINVRATKYLIDLTKEMKQLKALVYTSTAYSNCDREEIHEVLYKNRFNVKSFLRFVEDFDGEFIDDITPLVLGKLPNSYVLTKALTEELLLDYGKLKCNLPVVIVRPSILSSTFKEPLPGWVDSWYTIGSISVAGSYGFLRSANTDPAKFADIVPTDYVSNCLIATALKAQEWNIDKVDVPVLNYVSSVEAPITWKNYTKKCFDFGLTFIPSQCFRYPCVKLTKYKFVHQIRSLYMHHLPACIVDFIASLIGSKFSARFYYRLLHNFLDDTSYFSTRQWKFHNKNVQTLWTSLTNVDQEMFPFSMKNFDWDNYLKTFLLNGRVHLLKESPDNLPHARKRLKLLKVVHYFIIFCECLFLFWLTMDFWIFIYFNFI